MLLAQPRENSTLRQAKTKGNFGRKYIESSNIKVDEGAEVDLNLNRSGNQMFDWASPAVCRRSRMQDHYYVRKKNPDSDGPTQKGVSEADAVDYHFCILRNAEKKWVFRYDLDWGMSS